MGINELEVTQELFKTTHHSAIHYGHIIGIDNLIKATGDIAHAHQRYGFTTHEVPSLLFGF